MNALHTKGWMQYADNHKVVTSPGGRRGYRARGLVLGWYLQQCSQGGHETPGRAGWLVPWTVGLCIPFRKTPKQDRITVSTPWIWPLLTTKPIFCLPPVCCLTKPTSPSTSMSNVLPSSLIMSWPSAESAIFLARQLCITVQRNVETERQTLAVAVPSVGARSAPAFDHYAHLRHVLSVSPENIAAWYNRCSSDMYVCVHPYSCDVGHAASVKANHKSLLAVLSSVDNNLMSRQDSCGALEKNRSVMDHHQDGCAPAMHIRSVKCGAAAFCA